VVEEKREEMLAKRKVDERDDRWKSGMVIREANDTMMCGWQASTR
jgi:hypothetical protein